MKPEKAFKPYESPERFKKTPPKASAKTVSFGNINIDSDYQI